MTTTTWLRSKMPPHYYFAVVVVVVDNFAKLDTNHLPVPPVPYISASIDASIHEPNFVACDDKAASNKHQKLDERWRSPIIRQDDENDRRRWRRRRLILVPHCIDPAPYLLPPSLLLPQYHSFLDGPFPSCQHLPQQQYHHSSYDVECHVLENTIATRPVDGHEEFQEDDTQAIDRKPLVRMEKMMMMILC